MIKHAFFENLGEIANFEGAESEKFNANFLIGNALFLSPLYRNRKPFFNIMSGLSHRPDQIYHLWKFTLGGP